MKIELLKPHTHAGKAYPPGAVIALDDDLARWLLDTGVTRIPITQKSLPKHEEKSQ